MRIHANYIIYAFTQTASYTHLRRLYRMRIYANCIACAFTQTASYAYPRKLHRMRIHACINAYINACIIMHHQRMHQRIQRMHQRIQRTHDASTIAHAYNFCKSHKFHVYSFMVLMVNPYNLYRVKKYTINIKIFIRKSSMKLLNH